MFERIAVPTPFQVGPVNAYLAGRTLVDPGPESDTAWEHLEAALADEGLAPGDLRQVLVTHPHPDHFGLANRLRAEGAEVVASPAATPIVEDFPGRVAHEGSYFRPLLVRHGLNEQSATTVVDLAEAFLPFAPSVEVDRQVSEGDEIGVDGVTLEVLDAEGHAPGEIAFAFDTGAAGDDPKDAATTDGTPGDGERAAIVGDQVLADITPNPLLMPPAEEGGERPSMVAKLNRSLRRLRERTFDRLLPGHREVIDAPAERIDAILAANEERTERVREVVDEPKRAVDVSKALFGDLPATELFPGMSEAIGHLDLLVERGALRTVEDDGTIRYAPIES